MDDEATAAAARAVRRSAQRYGWRRPLLVQWVSLSLGLLNIGTCWTAMLPERYGALLVATVAAVLAGALQLAALLALLGSLWRPCCVRGGVRDATTWRSIALELSFNGSGATLMATIGLTGFVGASLGRAGAAPRWAWWLARTAWVVASVVHVVNQPLYVAAAAADAVRRESPPRVNAGGASVAARGWVQRTPALLRRVASGDWFPPTVGVGAVSIAAAQLRLGETATRVVGAAFATLSTFWVIALVPVVLVALLASRRLYSNTHRGSAVMAAPLYLCFVAWVASQVGFGGYDGSESSPEAAGGAAGWALFHAFFAVALLCSTLTLSAIPFLWMGPCDAGLASLTFPLEITTIGIIKYGGAVEQSGAFDGAFQAGGRGAAVLRTLAWVWLGITSLVVVGVAARFAWAIIASPRIADGGARLLRRWRGNGGGVATEQADGGVAAAKAAAARRMGGGGEESQVNCSPWASAMSTRAYGT